MSIRPAPRQALLVDLHWLAPYGESAATEVLAACHRRPTPIPSGCLSYTHRLVAASAPLIRRHLRQLTDVPLVLATTPRAAQRILLDRARTLLERGYRTATVLADPRLVAAITNFGLRPPPAPTVPRNPNTPGQWDGGPLAALTLPPVREAG